MNYVGLMYRKGQGVPRNDKEAMMIYGNGKKQGKWVRYREDGSIYEVTHYQYGHKHGLYEQFRPNGALENSVTYVQGNKTGEWRYFYEDGSVKSIVNYADGKKHGISRDFNRDCQVVHERYYWGGKQQGTRKRFNYNMQAGNKVPLVITLEEDYVDDKRHGKYIERDMFTGKTKVNGQYHKNAKVEVWTYYNADGTVKRTENCGPPPTEDALEPKPEVWPLTTVK